MNKEYIDIKVGDKWASEFNLVTVSTGDRYTPPVFGNINSNTSTVAGKRGVYKWRTQYNEKTFAVNMAFDNLSMRDVSKIKSWLNPSKLQKLIFSDEPYKFYYACLNSDPKFEFLPFKEESGKQIGDTTVYNGTYKGELTLEFIAIDGMGYSEAGDYEQVEIEPGIIYMNSEYFNTIQPWVQSSNLLNNDQYQIAANIYTKSFIDADTGRKEDCGLGADLNHRFYLLNSGDTEAKLNLKFDLIVPKDESIVIYTKKVVKKDGSSWEDVEPNGQVLSAIVIESFKDYLPFINYLGQEKYDILMTENPNADTLQAQKEIINAYQIQIDSELREIYIVEKLNENNVLNLNKFNGNRDFLKLCESNFVDYSKPFPTITLDEEGAIERESIVYSGTAIDGVYFNEVFLGETTANYRLTNVHFNWKHTYN